MPDIAHKFTSAIADGGDATLVRPSNWNDDHVWPHAYDVVTLTLLDGQYEFQLGRITVSSTNRLTMAGTARMAVLGWFASPDPTVAYQAVGWPKYVSNPFKVLSGYEYAVINRLTLQGPAMRVALQGDADMILTNDFATRARLVLAGGVGG